MTEIPARFEIGEGGSGPLLRCTRPDCTWWEIIRHTPLTELVALAREHVEEEHRG